MKEIENKVNQWLETLSAKFGAEKWHLDNKQCRLKDNSGATYLTMEWIPENNLLLLAFPLGNLESNGLNNEETMFELLLLNTHAELLGKAWIGAIENNNQYMLMSTIDIEKNQYSEFEQQWFETNDLAKLIQFAITSKMPMNDNDFNDVAVRV